MTARISWIFTAVVMLATAWEAVAGDPVEDLLAATFRISDREHSGTCFLVTVQTSDASNPRRVILSTAAHVLEQMVGPQCELILRAGNDEQGFSRKVTPIGIRDADKPRWTRHPDVDVACMFVELPENVAVKPISFEQIAGEPQLINRTVRAGLETWISCFPAKLEANEAGWPILRRGSIASHPLLPVKAVKTILIDYNVFGGDSGAPIAIIVDGNPLVVGVASSMQRQTDKSTLPFEERTMHTPLGLSIAVQAHYLRETIDVMLAMQTNRP